MLTVKDSFKYLKHINKQPFSSLYFLEYFRNRFCQHQSENKPNMIFYNLHFTVLKDSLFIN